MAKILTLKELGREIFKQKRLGKTVAMITGCFDVIHMGHIKLFRFAKSKADLVIVGLDSDNSIRLSKGKGRPVNDQRTRLETLSELRSIDFLFGMKDDFNFKTATASKKLTSITSIIRPTYLVTNPYVDDYWKEKQQRAELFGSKLLFAKHKRKNASTTIISKIIEAEL